MAKAKTYPAITRALAHYEAALATLQETLSTVDRDTLRAIDSAHLDAPTPHIPGALNFQYCLHDAGDVFRIAKKLLDPNRALPSRAPKVEVKDAA